MGDVMALPQAQPDWGAAGTQARHRVPAGGAERPLCGLLVTRDAQGRLCRHLKEEDSRGMAYVELQ